jgi:transcriptional regulator with GAF, ATPase, and Fis domain
MEATNTTAAPDCAPKTLLLNASVLVFLFRALAGARSAAHREEVSRQLLELVGEFVPSTTGMVVVGAGDEEVATQFRENALRMPMTASRVDELWQHLVTHGPWSSADGGMAAIPIYATGSMAGVMVLNLENQASEHMETLSAVASLAAVAIESVREVERVRRSYAELESRLEARGGIVGQSPAIQKLLDRIHRLAPRDTTVLIQGESGTGKELVARLLHRGSARAEGPFIAINCAAIAEALLESELFGHEKGSFTGATTMKRGKVEMAAGGTLFLDEIGELAPSMQAKLLRVLQQREFERVGGTKSIQVDIRIVAATNRDLGALARSGGFRDDLYHRLNVVTLRTPPLRERKEDLAALAAHFLALFSEQCKRPTMRLSVEAERCLESYDWPGNVRELQNALEHAVVLADGDTILASDLPESVWESAGSTSLGAYQSSLTDAKRESIVRAYEKGGGDYKAAAALLGIHPNYLLRLVRNLGLRDMIRRGGER